MRTIYLIADPNCLDSDSDQPDLNIIVGGTTDEATAHAELARHTGDFAPDAGIVTLAILDAGETYCPNCNGIGRTWLGNNPVPCPICRATGAVTEEQLAGYHLIIEDIAAKETPTA